MPTAKKDDVIEIYPDTRRMGACASCGAALTWATTVASGTEIPFNARQFRALAQRREKKTARTIQSIARTADHWSTCPGKSLF